jgi:PAS domain-containing protein
MSDTKHNSNKSLKFRELAKKIYLAKRVVAPEYASLPESDVLKLVNELQVHQLELEMQNDELRQIQLELDESRLQYLDLFDLAPVGYLMLNEEGVILQANFTASSMFSVTRDSMIREGFFRFIASDYRDIYYIHSKKLLSTGEH